MRTANLTSQIALAMCLQIWRGLRLGLTLIDLGLGRRLGLGLCRGLWGLPPLQERLELREHLPKQIGRRRRQTPGSSAARPLGPQSWPHAWP